MVYIIIIAPALELRPPDPGAGGLAPHLVVRQPRRRLHARLGADVAVHVPEARVPLCRHEKHGERLAECLCAQQPARPGHDRHPGQRLDLRQEGIEVSAPR
jgi:hypothetical protein